MDTSAYIISLDHVLKTTLQSQARLLCDDGIQLTQRYLGLSLGARHLVARLIFRVSKWIPRASYSEYFVDQSQLPECVQAVLDAGLCETPSSTREYLTTLSVGELKHLASIDPSIRPGVLKKPQLIERLCGAKQSKLNFRAKSGKSIITKGQQQELASLTELHGKALKVVSLFRDLVVQSSIACLYPRDLESNPLETMLLSHLKVRTYPNYKFEFVPYSIFHDRNQLLGYWQSLQVKADFDAKYLGRALKSHDPAESLQSLCTDLESKVTGPLQAASYSDETRNTLDLRYTDVWIYVRVLLDALAMLTIRFKRFDHEVNFLSLFLNQNSFVPHKRGYGYIRKAQLQMQIAASSVSDTKTIWLKRAWTTCCCGLEDNHVDQLIHVDLRKRVSRLEKSLKLDPSQKHNFSHLPLHKPVERVIHGEQVLGTQGSRRLLWTIDENLDSTQHVEQVALAYYSSEKGGQWRGMHSENKIVCSLFYLCLWDVIFDPCVQGVLQHAYQTAPLDLHTRGFYNERKHQIETRLHVIESECEFVRTRISQTFAQNPSKPSCPIDWAVQESTYLEIASCISRASLSLLFRRLAQDYKANSSGMPDLFLWNPNTWKCLFSEVKSANDTLSDKQVYWIHYLVSAGVDVELCKVVHYKAEAGIKAS